MRRAIAAVLSWIPNWLGFVLIIAAGIASIIAGAVLKKFAFIPFGISAIVASILAWANGATSQPKIEFVPPAKKFTFGGTVANVDDWVTVVVILLFAASGVISIFVK